MKKKSKKSYIVGKIQNVHRDNAWRAELDSIFINDDDWWCIVTMMVETIFEHNRHVFLFNEAAEKREQTIIYPLSRQKAIVTVKTLSTQDPEKCPAVQGICHYANTVLNENNGDMSTWLVARIIKYLIYRAKIEHVGRVKLQADVDREIDEESRIMRNIDGSSKRNIPSPQSTIRSRRANSSETGYMFNDKANTRLRKRGEEWRDLVYVDDTPFDGPNLYVVLSGFHDPDLPAELFNIGVPLTCILEIKSLDEQHVTHDETIKEDLTLRKEANFEDYRTIENMLSQFWTVTNDRLANPSMYPTYSDIAVLVFCPPVLPETFNAVEKELLKRDIYDGIFSVLYHLYNLYRQHRNYLRSMKLERRIVDRRDETTDTKIYEDALNDIPNECISVPLILGAMLLQVEANSVRSFDECSSVEYSTESSDVDVRYDNALNNAINDKVSVRAVRDKLKLLDFKYELSNGINQLSQLSDFKLILHGDTLRTITSHVLNSKSNLIESVLRALRNPRIINIWQDSPTESKIKFYSYHIDNIADIYNGVISREEIMHYLHLLMFDKLIFGRNNHKIKAQSVQPSKDEMFESKYTQSTIKRTRSASKLTALATSFNLRRSRSDTEIDYGRLVDMFSECLFALIDIRETLLPGYLCKNVPKRSYERPTIEEYEDVELLPDRVFLQVAHKCFQSFDRVVARYFEPTDSVLLYFSNNNEVDSVPEETSLSSIRTPVRLRDFCKYIVEEEAKWIKREQETHQSRRVDPTGRFMKKSVEVEDDAIILDDECFVLPDSLKARHLMKSLDRDMQKEISETKKSKEEAIGENAEGEKMTRQRWWEETPMAKSGSERADGRAMSEKTSMREKKSNPKIDDADTSFLTAKKILSLRCAEEGEPYDFVGYDLGSLRVQVSHRRKKFLLRDDISVHVELEDWLYGYFDLRVAVTLQECTLRLSNGVGRCQTEDTFHLTTKKGIILGFCRNRKLAADPNLSDCHWRNLAFDFRASSPSGLLIEPTIGDGTKNPFCIRQSYISKRSEERAGATREICRNFLRNGTVLKYLDDNTVVMLRPNGVIVTCMDFDKLQSHDESTHQTTVKTELGKGNSGQLIPPTRKKKVTDSTHPSASTMDIQSSKQEYVPLAQVKDRADSLITFTMAKVLRYSVVNYDGRHYEVLNDLVVREHDRLLVRTLFDYEVNEMFTHRADDTDTLFLSNGELVVTFADGTRITTGYIIEEQPIICEWSEDELRQYFRLTETNKYDDGTSRVSSSIDSKLSHEDSSASYPENLPRVSTADGFVSILLTFRMEHKDYATVSYDQSAVRCTLSMPDHLRVSISRRGHYEVSIGDEVNLKIRSNDVVLSKVCITCGGRSTSTYQFCESSEAGLRTILTTIDILGNVLEVKSDGSTCYHREDRRYVRRRYERNGDVLEHNEERGGEEEDANLEARFCKHERYCETLKFSARSQYRIFAMNRDLTACEYLHRSVRREQEMAAVFDDKTSMIQYPISRRPELRRLITFVPVEPELGSKEMSYRQRVR